MAELTADLEHRLQKVEDELAIQRIVLSYGPAADGGLASLAASVWDDDGIYDWDAEQAPHDGRDAIAAMLQTKQHQALIANGAAHFTGPPLIHVDGDRATAITYSLVVRRDGESGRFFLWRASAARWELARDAASWRVRRRTHRLLDDTGAGRDLFAASMQNVFGETLP